MVWKELPSWVKKSIISALFSLALWFIFIFVNIMIGFFKNDFSFSWSSLVIELTLIFTLPVFVIGAILGIIIHFVSELFK